jgi:cell division protein ZapE
LSARTDYRLEKLDQAPVYHTPLGLQSRQAMDASWKLLTGKESGEPETLSIKGRELAVPLTASGAARLSFDKLCREARSALDYLALARRYHTVFIEDVPQMGREQHNAAKRFILLIDTLYDNHVRVVISAATEPDKLYTATSGTEAFEFKRTASRLHEMQSRDYIAGFTDGDESN